MRDTEDGMKAAVDSLYAAAAGECAWRQALETYANHLGGAGSVVFDLDLASGEIVSWSGFGLEDGERDYAAHLNAINPRMKYSMSREPGHIARDAMFISDREMDRHEFYAAIERLSDVRYFIGTKLQQCGDRATFTSVEFNRRHGAVTDRQVERFRTLSAHARNAWNIRSRIDRLTADRDREVFVNDRLPWGVVCLDGKGRVIDLNAAAERILSRGDGLTVTNGRLHAAKAAENRSLHAMIADMIAAPLVTGRHVDAIAISRLEGRPAYGVQLVPYVRHRRDSDRGPAVIGYITDPRLQAMVGDRQLHALFGLSSKEAQVALAIAGGQTLRDAARAMDISVNTARNHLRSVFRKTETRSQVDLVRLLIRLLPGGGED